MARSLKTGSTARGLGWRHQQNRANLLRHHVDGSPCWWCGQPMFQQAERNWDGQPLAADHTHPRAHGGTKADRLMCHSCNSQRQAGKHDDVRPAVTGTHPRDWKAGVATSVTDASLAMDW